MFTTNTSIMDSLCLHGGDTCDAGNPFDINSTSINSTLLLLCSYPARVAMLILSASFIIFANLLEEEDQLTRMVSHPDADASSYRWRNRLHGQHYRKRVVGALRASIYIQLWS